MYWILLLIIPVVLLALLGAYFLYVLRVLGSGWGDGN